jgi:predicted cation transporter
MARGPRPDPGGDPVLLKRARIARWVDLGQKVGYGAFGLAVVAFLVGFVVGLEDWVVTLIVACIVVGSIVLAPAIVFGYAVKAADRADRDDDW